MLDFEQERLLRQREIDHMLKEAQQRVRKLSLIAAIIAGLLAILLMVLFTSPVKAEGYDYNQQMWREIWSQPDYSQVPTQEYYDQGVYDELHRQNWQDRRRDNQYRQQMLYNQQQRVIR